MLQNETTLRGANTQARKEVDPSTLDSVNQSDTLVKKLTKFATLSKMSYFRLFLMLVMIAIYVLIILM